MRIFTITLCLLLPSASYAQWVSCEDCRILRGDADCSNDLTINDATAILNGLWQNEDAADADDTGTIVQTTDAIYLLNFLFNGGPPPPCPTVADLDPTPDNLEICCSQRTNNLDIPLTSISEVSRFGCQAEPQWTFSPFGTNNDIAILSHTEPECEGGDVCTKRDIRWNFNDIEGTTGRKSGNVQRGFYNIRVSSYLDEEQLACFQGDCEDSIWAVNVNWSEVFMQYVWRNAATTHEITVVIPHSFDDHIFTIQKFGDPGVCQPVICGDFNYDATASGELLYLWTTEACDKWELKEVTVDGVECLFEQIGGSPERAFVLTDMTLEIEVDVWWEYEACGQ